MDATWLDMGGVRIRNPVTAGTNLVLAVQCAWYYSRLRRAPGRVEGHWALFFLGMAVATLAGVPKHGLSHLLRGDLRACILWTSSVAAGWAVFQAQRATIAGCAGGRRCDALSRAAAGQLALFYGACLALGPRMDLLIAHTTVGLLPVIAVESERAVTARSKGRHVRVAAGLGVSFFSAPVYLLELSLGSWLTHIDVAHLLMGLSYHVVASAFAAAPVPKHVLATRRGAVYL